MRSFVNHLETCVGCNMCWYKLCCDLEACIYGNITIILHTHIYVCKISVQLMKAERPKRLEKISFYISVLLFMAVGTGGGEQSPQYFANQEN